MEKNYQRVLNIGGFLVRTHEKWNAFIPTMFHSPVETGRKLNVHKTFRRRPRRLLNVLGTFNLRPVSSGRRLTWVLSVILSFRKGRHAPIFRKQKLSDSLLFRHAV